MSASDVLKQLVLTVVLMIAVTAGFNVLPNSRLWTSLYCFLISTAALAWVVIQKPTMAWVRSTLLILSISIALIGVFVAAGGANH